MTALTGSAGALAFRLGRGTARLLIPTLISLTVLAAVPLLGLAPSVLDDSGDSAPIIITSPDGTNGQDNFWDLHRRPVYGGAVEPTPPAPEPPTRIVIANYDIDLGVFPSTSEYPFCDVAQYRDDFAMPGVDGATYIYAHAQTGMFGPLLHASRIKNGAAMLGMLVDVYTADNIRYEYQVIVVKRHASTSDFSLAHALPPDAPPAAQWLVLQTSEGWADSSTKLQLAAALVAVYPATAEQAQPSTAPRVCR
jgi:hypothetical protein